MVEVRSVKTFKGWDSNSNIPNLKFMKVKVLPGKNFPATEAKEIKNNLFPSLRKAKISRPNHVDYLLRKLVQ
jgi:hypothetical protein